MLSPALSGLVRAAQDMPAASAPAPPASARAAGAGRAGAPPPLGEGQLEPAPSTIAFSDFLAALNPLQHLPGIGTIYRAVTGTTIPAPLRVAGGFLLGGPIGAVASAVGAAAEDIFLRARATPPAAEAPAPPVPAPPVPAPAVPAPAVAVALAQDAAPPIPAAPAAPAPVDAEERLRRVRLATEAYARQAHAPMLPMARLPGMVPMAATPLTTAPMPAAR